MSDEQARAALLRDRAAHPIPGTSPKTIHLEVSRPAAIGAASVLMRYHGCHSYAGEFLAALLLELANANAIEFNYEGDLPR